MNVFNHWQTTHVCVCRRLVSGERGKTHEPAQGHVCLPVFVCLSVRLQSNKAAEKHELKGK